MKESFVHVCVFVVAVIVFLSGNDVSARRPKPPSQLTRLLAMTENRHHQSHSKRGQPVPCAAELSRCDDGSECILHSWLCDGGTPDCDDGSDERNCPSVTCPPDRVKCATISACIPLVNICDGRNDCPDKSDEFGCAPVTCPPNRFKCATSPKCIPKAWICDGDNDCLDKSDEVDCGASEVIQPEDNGNGSNGSADIEASGSSNDGLEDTEDDASGVEEQVENEVIENTDDGETDADH